MRFNFVGEIIKSNKKPMFETGRGKNGKEFLKLNLGIKAGTDSAYPSAFGGVQDEIKITSWNKDRYDVPWSERFDSENLQKAMRKYVVNFGDRKEFLSQYDQIAYLKEILPDYKGKVVVTGTVQKSSYNGKWYDNYNIQNIYMANDNEKPRLQLSGDMIFSKADVDTTDYKSKKIVTVNGYIEQYIDKDHPAALVPQVFVMNTSKLDPTNPLHKKALDVRNTCLQPKDKNYAKMKWEYILKSGQEEVEFDESQLTPLQKLALESGEYTLEDFRPTSRIYGPKITEMRMYHPVLRDEYVDGPIPYGTQQDVDEMLYRPMSVMNLAAAEEDYLGIGNEIDDLFA